MEHDNNELTRDPPWWTSKDLRDAYAQQLREAQMREERVLDMICLGAWYTLVAIVAFVGTYWLWVAIIEVFS